MPFEVLDSSSLPGDPGKPNDDAFAHRALAAVVMDGATSLNEPLMPGPSDAAWIARFGANRLMAHIGEGLPARAAVAAALADAEMSFAHLRKRAPVAVYETPYSSMMFVVLGEAACEALWYGDCAALVQCPGETIELVGDALAKRARERDRAAALAAKTGERAASTGVRETFLPALRASRNLLNTQKGGWCFGPDVRAADHVASAQVQAPKGTVLLLVTDGFLALVSDYDRYDAQSLMAAARTRGLEVLGGSCARSKRAIPTAPVSRASRQATTRRRCC